MSPLQSVLTFDGIDDYIEIPYSEKHNHQVFTLSCWAKIMQIQRPGESNLISSYNSNQGYFLMQRPKTNTVNFWIQGEPEITGPALSFLNVWTHFSVTFDGSKVKFYVNGEAVGQSIKSSSFSVNNKAPLGVGAIFRPETYVPYAFFAGQMSEICLWNKPRTQQEIQSDMNKRLTGKEAGLVGYWPLNEGSGNTAINKTGNDKNGIIRGATWKQEEISLHPAEPITGEFQIPTTSINGVEFTNKLTTDIYYKFTPSGTWKPKADIPECTAAGLKGFPPELQTPYSEALKPSQQYLKYQNNTYFALLAVKKTTGVVIEVAQEIGLILKPGETVTFLVNDFTPNYGDNTGTLNVKWSAT
jgi:hypothetical protein